MYAAIATPPAFRRPEKPITRVGKGPEVNLGKKERTVLGVARVRVTTNPHRALKAHGTNHHQQHKSARGLKPQSSGTKQKKVRAYVDALAGLVEQAEHVAARGAMLQNPRQPDSAATKRTTGWLS